MPSTDQPEDQRADDGGTEAQPPFRDAEAWLAQRGVRREPLVIQGPGEQPDHPPTPTPSGVEPQEADQARPPTPSPIGSPAPPEGAEDDGPAVAEGDEDGTLGDRVSEATAYARRATANAPLSEARLRSKMESRGYPPPVVTQAMQRARAERLVDDHAYAMALVEEGRGKGHAPLRIKTDMQKRDLSDEAIAAALDTIGDRDPEAQAFEVARDRAQRYRDVDTETAYRRLVGYLARRGYTEALSRKVARQAVFNDREPQRTAER